MTSWIQENRNWVFSGVGVFIISVIIAIGRFFWNRVGKKNEGKQNKSSVTVSNQNIVNVGMIKDEKVEQINKDLDGIKGKTHILFIDDDTKFKVVNILIKSGWTHTRMLSDVASIDDDKIVKANILFIDIQGVGRKLQFHDEGLGLAKAIKEKYPAKKVIIYSAQTQGDRFHEALRKADDILPKNADPYEFQQLTERLATEIFKQQ